MKRHNQQPTPSAIALVAGMLLLASLANARTTASGAGSSSPFSAATAACLKRAALNQKMCTFSSSLNGCVAQYQTDFANCFAAGKGVACATACLTARTKCEAAPLAAGKTCLKGCKPTEKAAVQACQGNLTCISSALGAFLTCKKACAQSPALAGCKSAFAGCLATCPGL